MLYTERDLEIAMVGNGLIETTPALSEHSREREGGGVGLT